MSVKTDGSSGLNFVKDIMKLLKDKWISNNVKKPDFDKKWEEKVVGLADSKFRSVLINLDLEAIQIYSLQQRDANNDPFWDWLHDNSITIEVRSGTSDEDAYAIASEIIRIIKNNVTLLINDREYVQILPGNVVNNNEDFRNLFRYDIEVSGLKYNP